jgi:hypothetical protein
MKTIRHPRAALIAAGLMVAYIVLVGSAARAQEPRGKPLTASNFKQAAPRGFGDRNNSLAQAMAWWHGQLFVGTARQSMCVNAFALWDYTVITVSESFGVPVTVGAIIADILGFHYPPKDPDLSCAPDGADLSVQAEIWSWTPGDNTWTRVFQSPLALNNPGPGAPAPPQVRWQGKKLPYEMAFRGLAPFTEPDGTEALYAFGVNTTEMWNRAQLPPPRILRSTDGVTFAPVPQTPGTFLGDLPFNSDHSSYRSPVSFAGKLFVLSGPIEGNGALIGSADPAKGDNAWFLASPPGMQFYDLGVFNGWLYLGGSDNGNGYFVMKTRAEGTPPYQLITVVPSGAYVPVLPSQSVVSMQEYFGRLYVGTGCQPPCLSFSTSEVIRINPDDTWDLVVGPPRAVPLPDGGLEWKYPLSGLDAGFGHTLNDHMWQMDDSDNYLYIGTYNASTEFDRLDPVAGPLLLPHMGAHLYRSHDGGWYYTAVTTTGFATPSDPYGGIFDFGIRTMAPTPYGFFLGTTNDYYGLAIFRGTYSAPVAPAPPRRVEIEPRKDGSALLSWNMSPVAKQYQIWRAARNPISYSDVYVGPYQQIGVTTHTIFVDSTVQAGQRYMYYVLAEAQDGNGSDSNGPTSGSINVFDPATGAFLGVVNDPSDQSNLVAFPLLTPSVTFAQLLQEVDVLDQRQRFKNPVTQLTQVQKMIVSAQRLAMKCQISAAISELDPREAYSQVLEPEATDLAILIAKLDRRLLLFKQFANEVISNEFCSQP